MVLRKFTIDGRPAALNIVTVNSIITVKEEGRVRTRIEYLEQNDKVKAVLVDENFDLVYETVTSN